jgi:hypothetical protein
MISEDETCYRFDAFLRFLKVFSDHSHGPLNATE